MDDTVPAASARRAPLHLRRGEWVQVRSEAQICATLDEEGMLEALPFMPEMRPFCGRRFRVKSRADRTVVEWAGYRRMTDAVHLEGVRCDGGAHDGCCRSCLLFWKEAWLERVDSVEEAPPATTAALVPLRTTVGDRYFCQATQLKQATSGLSTRELRPYLEAIRGEDVRPLDLLRAFAIHAHDTLARRLDRPGWSEIAGPCTRTPSVSLNLQPGERVRVKSREEVVATLDAHGRNRRMEFSREMLPYCGQEFTVLRRVERIIRDHQGKMIPIRDSVLLEGLVYKNRRKGHRRICLRQRSAVAFLRPMLRESSIPGR